MARSCRARKCSAAAAARPCSRSWARSGPRTDPSCGGGRRAGAPAADWRRPLFLPSRCAFAHGAVVTPIPTRPVAIAVAEVAARAAVTEPSAASAATVAVTVVTVALLQHRRGTFLVLVDFDGQPAQDVFTDA